MDYRFTPPQLELSATIDRWLDEVLPEVGEGGREGEDYERSAMFSERLSARGWMAPAWPVKYGGLGAGPMEQTIFSERFSYRRAPDSRQTIGVGFAGPTIIAYGTEAQKARHLSAITSGETSWCQGFSEPASGSDLASLQTRAVRDGDDYVINGQKIWTSDAHRADWCILMARTDPTAPKHKGISFFLVDMHSPGIDVRPLPNLQGIHGFNEVFFNDVRIPASCLVGEENRGWYVGTTTLDFERSSISGTAATRRLLDEVVQELHASGAVAPAIRTCLAESVIECEVGRMISYRVSWMQSLGQVPNKEASVAKVFSSELGQRVANLAVNSFGLRGQLRTGDRRAPLAGHPIEQYMFSVCSTIAGGTSEIQRNIIGQRGLGLPR